MKVFSCTDFVGKWPVGTSAVVVAETLELAELQLKRELEAMGFPQVMPMELVEIHTDQSSVHILQDGDY